MVEGEASGEMEINGRYVLGDIPADLILEELYPAFVDDFQCAFPDAQLQWYEPAGKSEQGSDQG